MQIEIDSLNDEQIWNMFQSFMEDFPTIYKKVAFEGYEFSFDLDLYFSGNSDSFRTKDHGNTIQIIAKGGNKTDIPRLIFKIELNKRINEMKRILREIYKKETIAGARNTQDFFDKLNEAQTTI